MKNLFKKLMLVAVAAMAFTACSQDVNEVNKVEKVTRYEFTANFADTRSGFAEKEEGATAYKSEWHEGDQIKLFITDYAGWGAEVTTPISAEGNFALELSGAPESFFMTVVSPAESWASEYTANIPAVQTPLANSVDPKAHLLQAQAVPVSGASAHLGMNHMAAYGKMTVKGVDFAIDHVVVDLKGSFYGYDRNLSYTINAANVENNTFWFATEPIDVAEFTVTAYDAEGNAVAKTVNVAEAGKTMSFNYGRVGTFSVSGLEVPAVPMFTSAYISGYSHSDFYLYFTDDTLGVLKLNPAAMANEDWEMKLGTYEIGYNYSGYPFFYPGQYSTYKGTYLDSGVVSFSAVDGQYLVEFTDIADENGKVVLERAMYKGTIEGLNIPDLREKLAAPSNVQTSVSGKTITITWSEVTGADGYRVKLYSPHEEYFEEVVTGTEYVYNAQLANMTYSFTIMSYAKDDNANYKSSNDAYADVTTEDIDPKMEVSESKLAFSADGGDKTFNVTLKNTDAEITYTQEGDWFSVEMSGNTFTVTAQANESETDARNGSITVTAGELSQPITITQSKKPSASTGGADGKTLETAYKFTGFKVGSDGGYPVLVFYGAEDGRVVAFEPAGALQSCTGLKKLTDGCWWPYYMFYYESYNESNYDSATRLDILLDSSYSWIEKTSGGFTLEYFYIVSNGEGIYYTYDGVFNC